MHARKFDLVAGAFLVTAQLLFLIPAVIYGGNSEEFTFSIWDLILKGVPWFLALTAGSFLIAFIAPAKVTRTLTILFIFLGVALYVQSALLIWDYGQLDGTDIAWEQHRVHALIDATAWVGIFLVGVLFRRRILQSIYGIVAFILMLQLVAASPTLFVNPVSGTSAASSTEYQKLFKFSASQNAIIIVLDSLQSPVFAELLKREPELAKDFQDFIFFPNTTSSFPSTLPSIPSILSGVPYESSQSLYTYFTEIVAKKSLPAILREAGFQISLATLPGFCRFFQPGECAEARRYPSDDGDERALQEYVELLDYALFRAAPHQLKAKVYNGDRWVFRELRRDKTPQQYRIDGSIKLVSRFEAEAEVTATSPTFKFIHLILPHPPLRVDSECTMLPDNPRLSKEGYLKQARCALRAASRLIQKFKALGIFDQSMIVLTADHGLRLDYGTNDPAYAKSAGLLQVSRALPILLIKPINNHSELKRVKTPAQLLDIAATISSALALKETFPGENILTLSETAERDRFFTDLSLRWARWKETKEQNPGLTAPTFAVRGDAWNPRDWRKVQ